MKDFFSLLFIISISTSAFARFKLSGKINNTTRADTFYVNIPYIYGDYHDNDVAVFVDATGKFNASLPIQQQKFGTIRFEGRTITLLLLPGKALVLNYNPIDKNAIFGGNSAPENRLLYQADLNGIPFFAKDDKSNAYAKLTLPELKQQVVKPWAAQRDKSIASVNASALSNYYKRLLVQEIKANYITQLNYFARLMMDHADRDRINNFILQIYSNVPLSPDVLPAGPHYYNFADNYIGYKETQIFTSLPPAKAKDPATFLPCYNITLNSANRLAKIKGKSFVNWILVRNTYPKNIAESWLAENIFNKCITKDLAYAKPLMEELRALYPNSRYMPYLAAKMLSLETLLSKNLANKDIIIADGYERMNSIYQIISKLKGKVVYLDIWGTWCGPCKEELIYNPDLKQHFKGKDVAFVYLDMDDDIKDGQWREFTKVNGIAGLHLRKNSKDIEPFWNELLPKGDGTRYYPTYFIFDKYGRLVQANAKRPSDKADLYKQIEQYL